MQPARIASEGTIPTYNPMAGDHYGNGVFTICRGDSTYSCCRADLLSQIEIGNRFAKRDLLQGIPHFSLKGCARRQQGEFEGFSLAIEVFPELCGRFLDHPPLKPGIFLGRIDKSYTEYGFGFSPDLKVSNGCLDVASAHITQLFPFA